MKVAAQAMMLKLIKDMVVKPAPTPQEEISKIYDRIGKIEENLTHYLNYSVAPQKKAEK